MGKPARRVVISGTVGVLAALAGCVSHPHAASKPPTAVAAPWSTDEPAPLVAGIRLGDALSRVRAVLGSPDGERELVGDARELAYWKHGLVVFTTDDQGVAMLGLLHPGAPVVRGVRVGDPVLWMEQRWGAMARRNGDRGSYIAGPWGIIVSIDTTASPERVRSITFGWTAPNRSAQLPSVDAPDLPR